MWVHGLLFFILDTLGLTRSTTTLQKLNLAPKRKTSSSPPKRQRILFSLITMDMRLVILFVLVLSVKYIMAEARSSISIISDSSVVQMNTGEGDGVRVTGACSICEHFTAQAISYMQQNKKKTEIISALHNTCSLMSPFWKDECIKMVDHYVQLLFQELDTIQPSDFCKKMNLCNEAVTVSYPALCFLCDHLVAAVFTTLRDPDVECKAFTVKYGPLILSDMEEFFETLDICATLQICVANNTMTGTVQQL